MIGRRKRDWLRWVGPLVCALAWLASSLAGAQPAGTATRPGGAKVLLLAPAQAELSARIRGQTRDLGIRLELAEPAPALDARAAERAAQEHGADVVVWAEASATTQLSLHILELETGRVRSRSVATPPNETLASSTTAEMGALVVRSELSALLAERTVRHEKVAAPPPPRPDVATAPAPAPPPPRPAAPQPAPPAPTRVRIDIGQAGPWLIGLAYRASHPIQNPSRWAHSLSLTSRRDLAGFALGLQVNVSVPFSVAGDEARISLQRTQLRVEGLKWWEPTQRVRLALGVAASLLLDRRSTDSADESWTKSPATTLTSGSFGLLGELSFRFSRDVGGFLAAGADAVPWRTRFVTEDEGQQSTIARLFWLDPWLMVGLFTRFGG